MRAGDEPLEDGTTTRVLEIKGQATLAAVKGFKEQAIRPCLAGRDVAANIAPHTGVFNFDDIGAHVGQIERGIGAGAILLDRHDADTGQWRRRVRGHSSSMARTVAAIRVASGTAASSRGGL